MKRKMLLLAAAGIMAGTIIAGESFARMQVNTEETAVITINTGNIGVELNSGAGSGIGGADAEYTAKGVAPGVWMQAPRSVTNVGDYAIYTRAIVNKYLVDKDGNKILDGGNLYDSGKVEIDFGTAAAEGWIAVVKPGDTEEVTLYYSKPLAPGEVSPNFTKALRLSSSAGNQYADLGVGFSVRIEAVQAEMAEKAMLAEWGVSPVFASGAAGTATDVLQGVRE